MEEGREMKVRERRGHGGMGKGDEDREKRGMKGGEMKVEAKKL